MILIMSLLAVTNPIDGITSIFIRRYGVDFENIAT